MEADFFVPPLLTRPPTRCLSVAQLCHIFKEVFSLSLFLWIGEGESIDTLENPINPLSFDSWYCINTHTSEMQKERVAVMLTHCVIRQRETGVFKFYLSNSVTQTGNSAVNIAKILTAELPVFIVFSSYILQGWSNNSKINHFNVKVKISLSKNNNYIKLLNMNRLSTFSPTSGQYLVDGALAVISHVVCVVRYQSGLLNNFPPFFLAKLFKFCQVVVWRFTVNNNFQILPKLFLGALPWSTEIWMFNGTFMQQKRQI